MVLEPLRQFHEIGAITGDSDNEVLILLRPIPGILQGLPIHHIKLNMGDLHFSPGLEIINENRFHFPFEELGHEFLVQEMVIGL
jgi:hypothetical protein